MQNFAKTQQLISVQNEVYFLHRRYKIFHIDVFHLHFCLLEDVTGYRNLRKNRAFRFFLHN